MNPVCKLLGVASALLAGVCAGGVARATTLTMDFDGLSQGASVHTYYDGGCTRLLGHDQDCGGPAYGAVWSGARVANLAVPQPSSPGVMHPTNIDFLSTSATLDVADGFGTGLSFYYASALPGAVAVYSGLDGSGSLLAESGLLFPSVACGIPPCWSFVDLSFAGTARSAIFNSFLGGVAFDNVAIGAAPVAPVPEPAALGQFGIGVLLLGLLEWLRPRAGSRPCPPFGPAAGPGEHHGRWFSRRRRSLQFPALRPRRPTSRPCQSVACRSGMGFADSLPPWHQRLASACRSIRALHLGQVRTGT